MRLIPGSDGEPDVGNGGSYSGNGESHAGNGESHAGNGESRAGVVERPERRRSREVRRAAERHLPVIPAMRLPVDAGGVLRFGDFLQDNVHVEATDHHAQLTAGPMKRAAAPVRRTDPPVRLADAPVRRADAPVKRTVAPVKRTAAPVKRTAAGVHRPDVQAGQSPAVGRAPRRARRQKWTQAFRAWAIDVEPSRALTATAIGVCAVLIVVAAALTQAGGGGRSRESNQGSVPAASARKVAPRGGAVTRPTPLPPTLTSPAVPLGAVSVSSGLAVFQAESPITVQLVASGQCWIEVRSGGPTGPVIYEGTLVAGQSRTDYGEVWMRLGNPAAATVSLDGQPISFPSVGREPYDIEVQQTTPANPISPSA